MTAIPTTVITALVTAKANTAVCGRGGCETDLGEVCDDGNTVDGDYCARDYGEVLTVCGDGVIEGDEVCDDGVLNSDDYSPRASATMQAAAILLPHWRWYNRQCRW